MKLPKNTLKYALIGGLILIGLTSFVLIRRKRKQGKTPFRRKAIKIALEEYDKWNKNGKIKEGSQEMYSTLKKYWDALGWKESEWSPTGTAWSSAFISYIMKKANAQDDFNYASSHARYIVEAIKNRKENNKNDFKGYKLDEKKLELGDLVCYARQGGVTYDTTGDYLSHCDIIVNIDGNVAEGIGGNVSDSVSKTKIPLTTDGFVKEGNKRFVVIKTK